MRLFLQRLSSSYDDTIGALYIDGKFECFTLEDEFRNVKIAGETRIPQGVYEIGFREVESPLTEHYRKKFSSFFEYHLEIKDISGFNFVYIHVGNTDDDTEGCVLVGDSCNSNIATKGSIGYSRKAFTRLYKKIYKALKSGEEVKIIIQDELYKNKDNG